MKHRTYCTEHRPPRVSEARLDECHNQFARLQLVTWGDLEYPVRRSPQFLESVLDHWYYEFFDVYRVFEGSYAQFVQRVRCGRPRRWRPFSVVRTPYREQASYRRQPHHAPKALDEQELGRREWKRQKQRDGRHRKPNFSSRKRWAKHFSNKYHRQSVRQAMGRGDYEAIGWDSFRLFKDSWMWD